MELPERCRSCGMPCVEKVDFLKGLPESVLEEIFRETSQKQYQAGETLFRETERAEAIYLLHEGCETFLLGCGGPGTDHRDLLCGGGYLGESVCAEQPVSVHGGVSDAGPCMPDAAGGGPQGGRKAGGGGSGH